MKKNILILLVGLIAGTTLTATAAYVYTARDIGYQPSDENWNVTNANDALTSLKDDLNTITNKVEGIERVYKAGEVELIALVSDDSFYIDSNGKYVLSNSDTGRTLLADTSTYKSLSSTDDCVGIVGQDIVTLFKGNEDGCLIVSNYSSGSIKFELSCYIDGVSSYNSANFEVYGDTYLENDYVKAQTNLSQNNYKITFKKGLWITHGGTMIDARTAPVSQIVGNAQRIAMVSAS